MFGSLRDRVRFLVFVLIVVVLLSLRGFVRVFFFGSCLRVSGSRVFTKMKNRETYVDIHRLGVYVGGRVCSTFCIPAVVGLARCVWFSSSSSSSRFLALIAIVLFFLVLGRPRFFFGSCSCVSRHVFL